MAQEFNESVFQRGSRAPVIHDFYKVPALPYGLDALEPVLSRELVDLHYNKHTAGYYKKTNDLVGGSGFEGLPLEDLVRVTEGDLFNQAAQAWNHEFYWSCLAPPETKNISREFDRVLSANFGSFEVFKELFSNLALDLFGSGWAWLTRLSDGKLIIDCRQNADTPIADDCRPLLTCDVWEHAYYLDYRNERETYLDAFWRIVNWDFVESNYAADRDRMI